MRSAPARQWLQPVHRLDKPTSGIVLFAAPGDALNDLKLEFVHRRTTKVYWAIVRGWTEDEGVVEKPLPTAHNPKPKEAVTRYTTLARTELKVPVGPYETSRYSLVECRPETGRFHQIRLHFRHLRHPIVGDSRYGDKRHNRAVASRHRDRHPHAPCRQAHGQPPGRTRHASRPGCGARRMGCVVGQVALGRRPL